LGSRTPGGRSEEDGWSVTANDLKERRGEEEESGGNRRDFSQYRDSRSDRGSDRSGSDRGSDRSTPSDAWGGGRAYDRNSREEYSPGSDSNYSPTGSDGHQYRF
jgi:hypothetical protein